LVAKLRSARNFRKVLREKREFKMETKRVEYFEKEVAKLNRRVVKETAVWSH